MPDQKPQTLADKELLEDALTSQKHITDTYNTYTNECATPEIRDDFMNILREEHQIQADVFTEMQKRGWYTPAPAEQQKINQTKQKFQSMNAQG